MPDLIASYLNSLQKRFLPGVWSRGVALARAGAVALETQRQDELAFKVRHPERPVHNKVQLWPEDDDYFCDCDDRADPCPHVAAAVAALKSGILNSESPKTSEITEIPSDQLCYYLVPVDPVAPGGLRRLRLDRRLAGHSFPGSLVAHLGGLQSGRITGPSVQASQVDFALDRFLQTLRSGETLDASSSENLVPLLRDCGLLFFEGTPAARLTTATPIPSLHIEVLREPSGHRVRGVRAPGFVECFEGGMSLWDGNPSVIRLNRSPAFTRLEEPLASSEGRVFRAEELSKLITEVLPDLEKKITVRVLDASLPRAIDSPPQLDLRLDCPTDGELLAFASIRYDSPYAKRNTVDEARLLQAAEEALGISPAAPRRLSGSRAAEWAALAFDYCAESNHRARLSGEGAKRFRNHGRLEANVHFDEATLQLKFRIAGGQTLGTQEVFEAWRRGDSTLSLLGGGFATLPLDWLSKYGARLERYFALRSHSARPPAPVLAIEERELADEFGIGCPAAIRTLADRLLGRDSLPQATLPPDLQANLRSYQRRGVDWLHFLQGSGMGAILADDMGLGKTLQALCLVSTNSLVVAPTSVLESWAEQARRFRPNLRVSVYHGASRKLDPDADLIITSHGLLRSEEATLAARNWKLIILDEAQAIRNPTSQLARAAHSLRADFRIALSGTPIENRLDDLWSQFQFTNPGLLGPLEDFIQLSSEEIRHRVKPFILRRLKRDVAPELPPRTEVVLHCELTPSERELYDSLLAAGRARVVELLENGGSILGALELLLRLRQAASHPTLVPGQDASSSSKLELLAETLSASLEQGHRALVFSQWTSMLDLVEARLRRESISYLRLDGSTTNRAEVVSAFQRDDGPSVLLLSLKAGGVGLTLTAADQVFLLDTWWNPAAEDQAADRAHRIGQRNPVLIHRLIARDTVEERILALQQRKRELARGVLDGGTATEGLTREDLLALMG